MKVWAWLFILSVLGSAQEPKFATRAREVLVPVSVMSRSGEPVESLGAEDFQVWSDGALQKIRMIGRDETALPVHAVIVVETSSGTEPALAKIRKTASVISGYVTNDMEIGAPSLAAVVTVGGEVRVAQGFTDSPDELKQAFARFHGGGDGAKLLDGVSVACDLLANRKERARRGCDDQ